VIVQSPTYAQVAQLVDQLRADEKQELALYLQLSAQERKLTLEDKAALLKHYQRIQEERDLTYEEWKSLFELTMLDVELREDFSDRREDWYGDDGR